MTMVINCINGIIRALATVLSWVLGSLPKTPFASVDVTPIKDFMGYMNWLIPVGTIITITTAWIACKFIYWIYSTVLRWIKMIS